MVELDLVSPLKRYLETEFDEAEAACHTDDLRALQLLRNGAMAIKQAWRRPGVPAGIRRAARHVRAAAAGGGDGRR